MKNFRPLVRLIISKVIEEKILTEHGVTKELAREFFEMYQKVAIPHPIEPGDQAWDPPRWVIERYYKKVLYRMAYVLKNPPGNEAILVTMLPEKKIKY
ncbi:MAG: hypothetical protein ABSH53_18015 [Holophaga sp.]|jgi:hypothetical protein